MTQPAIDLSRHHFMRELGDMVVFGTWIMNDDQEDTEPALVILPRHRPPSSVKPCVIGLSAAFKYDNPKYLARAAPHIAECLGFEDSLQRANKIATLIHDHIPDLVRMPVDPSQAIVVGEATVEVGGKRRTIEFTELEQTKQI